MNLRPLLPILPLALCALSAFALFLSASSSQAKLAPERWERLTEEERHQMTRAERYFDKKEWKAALSEYELFLQRFARSEEASYAQLMFAECTRQLGQVNTAIKEFRNVIDYFPETDDAGSAQYSIGVCLAQGGDAEAAAKEYEKVVEQWPTEDFGVQARGELCTILFRLGQFDRWLPHLKFLAEAEYKNPTVKREAQRRLLMHYLYQQKPDEGFALVEKTQPKSPLTTPLFIFADWANDVTRPPQHHTQTFNIQTLYGEQGKLLMPKIAATTVAFIEKQPVGDLDPEKRKILALNGARIYSNAGVEAAASERFAALLKTNPDDDRARMEFGQHLRRFAKFREARLVYHDMKDQYTGDREIAETYGEEKEWQTWVDAYQSMLAKHPDHVGEIQWRLGEVFQRLGRHQEAIAAFQQSQREPAALFQISQSQRYLKQFDAAIGTLMGVVNFYSDFAAEAYYRIAEVQAAKGDKEAAIRTLRGVCKNYKSSGWAGRAHQDLSLTYGVDVTLGGDSKKDDR